MRSDGHPSSAILRAAIGLAAISAVCAHANGEPAFRVIVQGSTEVCTVTIEGRTIGLDDLPAIARREARPGRRAHIKADVADAPYRCLGGAIYILQMAGFKDVGFDAEPPRAD